MVPDRSWSAFRASKRIMLLCRGRALPTALSSLYSSAQGLGQAVPSGVAAGRSRYGPRASLCLRQCVSTFGVCATSRECDQHVPACPPYAEPWPRAPAADLNMTEAARAQQGPTVALMTRRASAPSRPPSTETAVTDSTNSTTSSASASGKARSSSSGNATNSGDIGGENASAAGNIAKLEAASRAAKGGRSNPTLHQNHPEDACRYPNKRCYNKRAVKNNGELHKFCDAHRDSANRYQRRLEQRLKEKRIQSRLRTLQAQQAQQAQAQAQAEAQLQAQAQAHACAQQIGTTSAAAMTTSHTMLGGHYAMGSSAMPMYSTAPPLTGGPIGHQVQAPGLPQGSAPLRSPTGVPSGLWGPSGDEYEPFQHPVPLQTEDLDCLYLLFLEP